ncbi:MAG: hypothetical protein ABW061_06090, partial [Polyangiaceae bacterium]
LARYLAGLELECDSYYVETRLNSSPQTDLLLAFERHNPHLARVLERLRFLARGAAPASQPAWRVAERFIERWLCPTDPLHDAVSTVWFEFDDVLRPLRSAAPSLSACLVPAYSARFEPRAVSASAIAAALQIAQRALCGADGDAADFQRMNLAVAGLPPAGRFIHLSHMTARRSADLKLYGVVPRDELVPYLERIGFQGPLARLSELLESLATRELCAEDLYFDLNLSNVQQAGRASLGLAFSQQQVLASAAKDRGRAALLARLSNWGLCSAAQASALAEWGGASATAGSWYTPAVRRWLDLKCVISAQGVVQCKAYLGFAPRRSPFAIASLPRPNERAPL